MSNAFIPDQLHHMSKGELLDFAQTAHEENVKLVKQNQQLLTYLEDAHSHIGHLAAHLAGRIADGARFEMATRADKWREYCEKLGKK